MFIIALIVSIVLSMATTAILYSVDNARKNKLAWNDGDTEVIYTDWHIFNHSGFLQDDIRKAEYLLSIKGRYVLDNVIFEWERRGDSSFVRAKAIFKRKVDNDGIAEDKEVVE